MPITPFHMGPALVVKAAAGRRFSLMLFGFNQVVMDVEPLIGMLRGSAVLHGFTHTFVGATVIGAASVVVGRPICEWRRRGWNRRRRASGTVGAVISARTFCGIDTDPCPASE